ncbi:energy transducer TonB [Shewanella sp. D64]|uniref:energy transducer TonB n=1 Tax=unclassified Shewanella TaxID=196818 RepID=UPI0022BA2A61|nr:MULTISPECIES: energy transducer TonB [unclassified Shewanella]MEC4727556.1 energy transducer TonB [Shewanella sp. D64]MEC4739807.1 energy transducer TonB [Shewanella sp. E94]WBJ95805.1 energy transducer TonB [Shewanella sp. MTB7]
MNRYMTGIVGIIILAGCESTPTEQYPLLPLIQAELLSKNWEDLERIPPLYLIEDAIRGNEGCASIEYVITPDYDIRDIKVIASSGKYFAKAASLNVKQWKWSELPKGIALEPIKTSTQFQFCLETGDGHCSELRTFEESQCSGADVIYSIGYRIKRSG